MMTQQQSVVLFCLLSVAMGASIGRIAQNIHSDAVFLDAGLDTSSGSNGEFKIRPNTLPVGKQRFIQVATRAIWIHNDIKHAVQPPLRNFPSQTCKSYLFYKGHHSLLSRYMSPILNALKTPMQYMLLVNGECYEISNQSEKNICLSRGFGFWIICGWVTCILMVSKTYY